MKTFEIEAVVCGHWWEFNVNCPPAWRNSGCYDVEREFWQTVKFVVSAESLERALKLISSHIEDNDGVLYDPDTVKERDNDEADEEVEEAELGDPVENKPIPDRYCEEAC